MIRVYDGQVYHCIRIEPYTRLKDGGVTELAVWESECAQCRAPFRFRSPRQASKFVPNRRCSKHKRPGQRVRRSGDAPESVRRESAQ